MFNEWSDLFVVSERWTAATPTHRPTIERTSLSTADAKFEEMALAIEGREQHPGERCGKGAGKGASRFVKMP